MRPSNKTRNRNKSGNRRGSPGNIINRVFESAGPEGKVRGTPQQIIDKYISLAHDSQLAGDRVAAENLQQHGEHYSRLLNEAQKELLEKQNEQQASNNQRILNGQREGASSDNGKLPSKVIPESSSDTLNLEIETPGKEVLINNKEKTSKVIKAAPGIKKLKDEGASDQDISQNLEPKMSTT
jgi:uncharacterized protein with von Willebrand factor type A (vWA) domain